MGKEQVFNGGTRAEREVAARSDAVTAAEASQAEGIVSSSMLRLQAMKRYGEFPYKGPDGRIDIRKTLEGVNPLIEAVATLANDPKTPDDVVRRVVPMVGAVELLGSTLREVHTTAQSGGFPEDAVTITARYGTVVRKAVATSRQLVDDRFQALSDWSRDHDAPELGPAALRARIDDVEAAIDLERQDAASEGAIADEGISGF